MPKLNALLQSQSLSHSRAISPAPYLSHKCKVVHNLKLGYLKWSQVEPLKN